MLRAIIFDCDGVIADTEPLHLAAFQRVLEEEGLSLSREEYYARFLALDDRGSFTRVYEENGRALSGDGLAELIARKADYLEPVMRERLRLFPGAAEFIREASSIYPLAVASGALRREIELVLKHGGVRDCFEAIVSAEDVSKSKPDPEPFLLARLLLSSAMGFDLEPEACLVIEDSIHGIAAARRAGMRVLAVTTSYSKEELTLADCIVDSLEDLSIASLEAIF
ncbi:MAG TPA: HAD family phosphatase [Blastocatellia bacterium]|jgi:HAD superfamily hydrolase (TIGR01509 family)|nr:HAD family phosphatase [Blastocatellia bacterium]